MSQSQCHEIPGVQVSRGRESLACANAPPETSSIAHDGGPRLDANLGRVLAPARLRRRGKQPSQQRPPSVKDLAIYDRVVIQGVSQREAAEEFHVNQSNVSRKCARVIDWMGTSGREEQSGITPQQRLRYLVRFAEKKYDAYRERMEADYEKSWEPLVTLRESGEREAGQASAEFSGTVKVHKTTRQQVGRPTFLREARLALDSLLLLDWGWIGKHDVEFIPDPDVVAQRRYDEHVKQTEQRNRRLEWELERAQEQIKEHQQQLAEAAEELAWGREGRESLASTNFPPESSLGSSPNSAATSGGRESLAAEDFCNGCLSDAKDSRPRPRTPSKGSASDAAAEDGRKFLAEVKDVIASIEPVNQCDTIYKKHLRQLYENATYNLTHHGIVPERQQLPRLQTVRRGLPYTCPLVPDKMPPLRPPPPERWELGGEVPTNYAN